MVNAIGKPDQQLKVNVTGEENISGIVYFDVIFGIRRIKPYGGNLKGTTRLAV